MTARNGTGKACRAPRFVTSPLRRRRSWCAVAALVALGSLPSVTASATLVAGGRTVSDALPAPRPLRPFVGTALAGQGRWSPVGRLVDGRPVVYETTLEPPQDPGGVAGVAWMDTRLLRPALYSGSLSPGGYGWRYTAPVQGNAGAGPGCGVQRGLPVPIDRWRVLFRGQNGLPPPGWGRIACYL